MRLNLDNRDEMMATPNTTESENWKQLHIRLPENVHRSVRVAAATEGITIQEWVSKLIANAVSNAKTGGE